LPTIRSRCRRLLLRPLAAADVARAIAASTGRGADEAEVQEAAVAADGSVARALALLDGPALALRQRVLELLAQLPQPDPRALHALGDALGGSEPQTLAAFMDMVNGWLSARLEADARDLPRMARVAQAWDKVNRAPATSRPIISNASRWCSRCLARWPRRHAGKLPVIFRQRDARDMFAGLCCAEG